MTTPRDLDREFKSYFDGRAVGRAPDGLLDIAVAGVASTRQRPSLLVADRWRPQLLMRRAWLGPRVVAVVTVLLLLIVLATVLVMIGSSRRPAPPFGLAKPGLIAFDADGDLFASNLDGSGLVHLTSGPEFDNVPTYAPDGTLIAFESQQPDLSHAVFVMPATGGARVQVIEGLAETSPIAWSPDSRHVAVAARLVGEDEGQIVIGAIDDPGAVRLGGPDVFGGDPPGRRTAVGSPFTGRLVAAKRSTRCGSSMSMDRTPTRLRPISGTHGYRRCPVTRGRTRVGARSPHGRRTVGGSRFCARGVGDLRDVHVVDADGRNLRNVSNSAEDENRVAWSPDGTRLAYVRNPDTSYANAFFMVADADGSNARPVPGPRLSPYQLLWSPDGARLLGQAFADAAKGPNANQNTIIELDPSGQLEPVTTEISHFGTASYQRLAP